MVIVRVEVFQKKTIVRLKMVGIYPVLFRPNFYIYLLVFIFSVKFEGSFLHLLIFPSILFIINPRLLELIYPSKI